MVVGSMCAQRAIVAVLALVLAACIASDQPITPLAVVRISGSTSMMPALQELAAVYQQRQPNTRIELLGNGSEAGLAELKAGTVDIAAISWKPEGAEAPQGLAAAPFARDGIAIIVHPANRVAGLTLAQVRSIYRGELLDWKTVGGRPEEPTVISREDGSGTRAAFEAMVMNGEQATLNALIMPSSQAVVNEVARRPGAIGYASTAVLTDTVRAVPIEDLLPTPANVRSGAYHLTRYLYLYVHIPLEADVQRFLDFIVSPAGQRIIGRYHNALR
jgi:phosphate transport system substrate-binding protein